MDEVLRQRKIAKIKDWSFDVEQLRHFKEEAEDQDVKEEIQEEIELKERWIKRYECELLK